MLELIENEKKNRIISFDVKNENELTKTQNFKPLSTNDNFSDLNTTGSQFNPKKEFSERCSSKHLFSYNASNYGGESIPRDLSINRKVSTKLDSLGYNMVTNLLPVKEEIPRQKKINLRKKTKFLTKIDESLLSNAARERNEKNKDFSLNNVDNIRK